MGSAASTKKIATAWVDKADRQRKEGLATDNEKDVDEGSTCDIVDVTEYESNDAAFLDHKARLKEHPEIGNLLPSFLQAIETIEECCENPASSDSLEKVYNEVDVKVRSPAMTYRSKEQRRLLCDQLAYDKFVYTINRYCQALENTGPLDRNQQVFITYINCADIITSLSDRSSLICEQCRETGFLGMIIQHLKNEKCINNNSPHLNQIDSVFVVTCLSIVSNCAKGGVSRQFFAEHDTIKALVPYTKSSEIMRKSITYMALAYLVDEDDEQSDIIAADDNIIAFLSLHLKKALRSTDKTSSDAGISAEEIAQALSCLANNDKNKPKIIEAGTLPLLVNLMDEGDEKEKLFAVKTIWNLAFDDDSREKIKQQPGAMEKIESLKTHPSQDVQKAANGALWVLEGQKELRDKHGEEAETRDECQHVMISYQWDVQNLMIKVKQHLEKNGYRVWMDLEQMGGSTLQAMADAVENAAVVLMCVSQKYKDSPNCRVEAEYAFQLRKDVVPLMVEERYKPSGWLGAIVGTKFYINLAKRGANFGTCMKQLVRELGERGKMGAKPVNSGATVSAVESETVAAATSAVSTGRPTTASHPANKWSESEVKNWMKDNGIELKSKQAITGEDLIFLMKLREEAPEFFYNYVVQHLGIVTLQGMRRLRNALEHL